MTRAAEISPSWRRSARMATMQREMSSAQNRSQVICALNKALAPLSIAMVSAAARISYDRARRALETLAAMHIVTISGPKNNQRFTLTGMARVTGAPASVESAAEGLAGDSMASAARPGAA